MAIALRGFAIVTAAGVAAMTWSGTAIAQLDRALAAEKQINQAAAASQQRIDALSDEAQALIDEFRDVNRRVETLNVYNAQLGDLIASQKEEIQSLDAQIEDVTVIEREIMPLMASMVDALDQFVELDVPFLLDERRTRVAHLKDLMARADVSVSEKYRRIMEAYQIENDYGRAVDAYRGTIEIGGTEKTVDFLKIGRVAFLFVTLDDSEAGVWNQESRQWLDAREYRHEIREGLKMANKQVAFDLLTLPIPAPKTAAQGERG